MTCWTDMFVSFSAAETSHLQITLYSKVPREKNLRFARRPNQSFHMIRIALRRLPARRRQPVLRFRQASIKRFLAENVIRLFQFARMHAQIAVRGLQQSFQLIEGQRAVYRQRAYDSQPDPL